MLLFLHSNKESQNTAGLCTSGFNLGGKHWQQLFGFFTQDIDCGFLIGQSVLVIDSPKA